LIEESFVAGEALVQIERHEQGSVSVKSEKQPDLRQQVADGLFYTHARLSQNTNKMLESSAFLYGLIELLGEKGFIATEELDARKRIVGARLVEQWKAKGLGVMLQEMEEDKYTFQGEAKIDCENRTHLCKAACCRLRFALSRQDIEEATIKWDLGHPYMIAHGADGYCTHLDRGTCHCTVRERRPLPCRGYDCRQDKRIWLDFANQIINPNLDREDWPQCESPAQAEQPAA
jgi:hypothetical protein